MSRLADWTSASEADVILAAQVGDERAFAELYRRYQRKLVGFFLARGIPYDDIDDCTQTVWMNIVRTLPRFDTSKSFGTLLYTFCLNRYRNYYRDMKRYGCMMNLDDVVHVSAPELLPDERAEISMTLDAVEEELSSNPTHPGVEALLLWAQGYSYAEIAERQKVADTTVKMRMHHLRKKLAKCL